ncbi:MAG: hypothetical protein RL341_907 [Pseudomonadota bacterium]
MLEELVIRGLLFNYLLQRFTVKSAFVWQAFVFAALHIPGYGLSAFQFAFHMLAGLFLGAVVILTNGTWRSVGIHFIWNLGAYCLLGFEFFGKRFDGLLVSGGRQVLVLFSCVLVCVWLCYLLAQHEFQRKVVQREEPSE